MKQKIYIAGKITGLKVEEYTANFNSAKKELNKLGYDVISPIDLITDPNTDWSEAMKICITELLKCDGICMLSNWESSKGAKIEFRLARQLGLKIIFD